MRKTFKIGERCYGGIVQLDINPLVVKVSILDYVSKEELYTHDFPHSDNGLMDMQNTLESEYTSYYWAEKVTNFVKQKSL